MHQILIDPSGGWGGGDSRCYVNLIPVISEQTDSFEFLALGSSNLFCKNFLIADAFHGV